MVYTQDEPYLSNQTYTYSEAINEYKKLAKENKKYAAYFEIGESDYGLPLSLFVINSSGKFTQEELRKKNVFLINNAIHPGEPEGVDACIKMCKNFLHEPLSIPENVIIAIIPLYNVGGAHNRNCCTRANQDGPEEYGFRGNSKNLDLNRDFIKADSKNTRAFYRIFHFLKPAVFIDTHTSNGADYQYVMTLITSQRNKMNPVLAEFVYEEMNPTIYKKMEDRNFPMIPYVTTKEQTPDGGIVDFLETPRYSTGYTNLFNCISFVAETHMLKPFPQRVEATYELLMTIIDYMEKNSVKITETKKLADADLLSSNSFPLFWELDTSDVDSLLFKGYEAEYPISEVTGKKRLYYNRNRPYEKYIPYYNQYHSYDRVSRPEYYVIPQAWDFIIPLMKQNEIPVYRAHTPISTMAERYFILHFETVGGPYEGHYLHHAIEVDKDSTEIEIRKGDYLIPTKHVGVRFVMETLEPHAMDSYLAWNYFDAILQQKEWFSAYVFEDEAQQILNENPALKADFENKKNSDPEFASNTFAQLYFIYKASTHYEPTHNLYPVFRVMKPIDLSNFILMEGENAEIKKMKL